MAGNILKDCFSETFSSYTEKKAIRFLRKGRPETEMSYGELARDTNRVGHTFMDLGINKGDRVILCIEKSMVFVIVHLALQKIGAISVPLNPGFKKAELDYLIQDADASLVVSGPEQTEIIQDINSKLKTISIDPQRPYRDVDFFRSAPEHAPSADVKPEDPGVIIYTSGTTGKPKGAVLTQANLVHDAKNIMHIWEITHSDTLCHALPLFHVHGLCFALHTALMAGSFVLMLDGFSPETVLDMLSVKAGEMACTVFMAVPSMYGKLMARVDPSGPSFDHIRLWTSGSAPLLVQDFERIEDLFGKQPVEREGMSETGMNFSNPIRGVRKPGSIGLPLPGLQVRIVDPATFKDVVPGQTGEIWLKGPSVTPGYWRKPEETAKAFENGWFRTGDLGNVDEDGYYYLTDRIKHIIISGGENISPKEVEAVINRCEGVLESSVVGIPDAQWGEKVMAAVVKGEGATIGEADIDAYCRGHLHNWKCPKEIVFVKELPRNTMGKVLKDEVTKFFTR